MIAVIILIVRYIIVIALFTFLFWVVFTLWRELKFQSQMVASKKVPMITLRLETGQEFLNYDFEKPEILIGRDEDCDLKLNEEIVSSHHARLYYRSSQWWVEDMLSTNGTYLNDGRIDTATVIIKGDDLRIGHQIISIDIQSA